MAEKKSPRLTVVPGPHGWAQATWRPGEIVVLVRFEQTDETLPPRLRAVELRVSDPWLEHARDVPLSRIENAVNADANILFELVQQIDEEMPGNDPAAFFAVKARICGYKLPPRVYLDRPAKRRLDDDFYQQVATAYVGALAWGLNPRKTLAVDSDTPADTVARWIREARRRGYLSAGEPGKASGRIPAVSELELDDDGL